MTVVICDNNASNLSSAKSSLKGKIETFEMDVSKVEDFEKLKSKVEKEFGGTSPLFSPPHFPITQVLPKQGKALPHSAILLKHMNE